MEAPIAAAPHPAPAVSAQVPSPTTVAVAPPDILRPFRPVCILPPSRFEFLSSLFSSAYSEDTPKPVLKNPSDLIPRPSYIVQCISFKVFLVLG